MLAAGYEFDLYQIIINCQFKQWSKDKLQSLAIRIVLIIDNTLKYPVIGTMSKIHLEQCIMQYFNMFIASMDWNLGLAHDLSYSNEFLGLFPIITYWLDASVAQW